MDYHTTVYKVGELEGCIVQGALGSSSYHAHQIDLGKFLHLDFAALLRMTPSIFALLGTLKGVTR
jgi:hypothetical protein